MKKIALILAFFAVASSVVSAQQTVYVSARGSETSRGWSEAEPTTFSSALRNQVMTGTAKKIIIIGALNMDSAGTEMILNVYLIFQIPPETLKEAKRRRR